MTATRAVIYARVSQDRNATQRSVTEQEAECRAVCERNGWKIVKVLVDNDLSASAYATKDRPAYRSLLELIDAGDADVLVTWESSRLTRDLAAFLELRTVSELRNVRWCVSGQVRDLSDISDSFSATIDAVVNERASRETSKRVRRAMNAAAQEGRPHGRQIYGYRRIYDPASGTLLRVEADPEEAETVRLIFRRTLAGDSLGVIVRDLGDGWIPQRVRRVLDNAAYAGQRVHQGKIVGSGIWPALVSLEDWQAVRRIREARTATHARDATAKHLLSGILRCAKCGEKMYVTRLAGKWLAYECPKNRCATRNLEYVDHRVTEYVVTYLGRPDALAIFAPVDDVPARDEVSHLEAELAEYVDLAVSGKITPSSFATIEASLTERLQAARERVVPIHVPAAVRELSAATDVRAAWQGLPVERKREAIRALITVSLTPPGRGSNHNPDPECIQITPNGRSPVAA